MNRRDFFIRLGLAVPAVKTIVCFGTGIWRPNLELVSHRWALVAQYNDFPIYKERVVRWFKRVEPLHNYLSDADMDRLLRDLKPYRGTIRIDP